MKNLLALKHESYTVRFIGTADKPEWVAADVVEVLFPEASKTNRRNYLAKVPAEWKDKAQIMTPGGKQTMTTIYESGLYHLIARSNSPVAKTFQIWLFEEVLPSIREHGTYPPPAPPQPPTAKPKALPGSWVANKDYKVTNYKPDQVVAKHAPANSKAVDIKTRAGMKAVIEYARKTYGINGLTQSQMEFLAIEMASLEGNE